MKITAGRPKRSGTTRPTEEPGPQVEAGVNVSKARKLRRGTIVLLTAALAASAACSTHAGASSPSAPAATITVAGMSYSPSVVTIKAGGTVTWTWSGAGRGPGHDVHLDDGTTSAVQSQGTWSHTFTTTGTYHFHCDLHPMMKGTITVT